MERMTATKTPQLPARDRSRLRELIVSGAARLARERAGLTLAEVAAEVGAPYDSTISRWERGERRPTGPQAAKYLALIDDLVAGRLR